MNQNTLVTINSESKSNRKNLSPKIIIPMVIAAAIILVVISEKNQHKKVSKPEEGSPQSIINQYLDEGTPFFIYFYSDSCVPCHEMEKIIEEVYPEFSEMVPLVSVDVNDRMNKRLLEIMAIPFTPTQYFIDASGKSSYVIGAMSENDLHIQLQILAESVQ